MKLGFDRSAAAAAALAALLALPLRGDDSPVCPAIDPAARAVSPQAGLRVFRDPVTGQLRAPTREEAAALARAMEAEAAPTPTPVFEIVEYPDGMKSVDLKGAFMHSVVVKRHADGSVTFSCVPGTAPAAPVQPAASLPAPQLETRPTFEEK